MLLFGPQINWVGFCSLVKVQGEQGSELAIAETCINKITGKSILNHLTLTFVIKTEYINNLYERGFKIITFDTSYIVTGTINDWKSACYNFCQSTSELVDVFNNIYLQMEKYIPELLIEYHKVFYENKRFRLVHK